MWANAEINFCISVTISLICGEGIIICQRLSANLKDELNINFYYPILISHEGLYYILFYNGIAVLTFLAIHQM